MEMGGIPMVATCKVVYIYIYREIYIYPNVMVSGGVFTPLVARDTCQG